MQWGHFRHLQVGNEPRDAALLSLKPTSLQQLPFMSHILALILLWLWSSMTDSTYDQPLTENMSDSTETFSKICEIQYLPHACLNMQTLLHV